MDLFYEGNYFASKCSFERKHLYKAELKHIYFDENESLIPFTDLLVENRMIFVINIDLIEPLSSIHKMILSDI